MRNTSYEVQKRWEDKTYGRISTKLPIDMVDKFRAKCVAEGVSQNSVIWKGIEKFLEETK